ncbi:bifunctional 4-hydroxy-2-oxoglutarate aldolase/2-dehydro-3-deoxy-phosphogluconate aldolase [Nocardiopsis sp. EMB25]|uniref:bifunctional 4-hydroxy-2-oxoglutarate aldolase/2-dehydro-3-deoxy-phosphogluconate aldolase n=1 Tax=Nocardiopsis sp. EMB25 TaxID=2835867 RepID=UPI002284FC2A|nr:bifunctional 4-hydroxy-2-oxoglutarate aldolase/2-dehydro-3-deoxy-phosphogluconate aldolase [Nocardiopsis sp. EMB25]MCY9786488.1 bifunctional 4-hydroxy-2-oxoglutarate aldolase/2-dehydro-3-deoxy-phosphogluconate aldolase [Nocardiopsis sp. EMB25]
MTSTSTTTASPDGGGAPHRPIAVWADYFTDGLSPVPLMLILRGVSPDDAVSAAREAWRAGVRLVEVTLEREEGLPALEAVVRAAEGRFDVGAGTLTTPERLRRAVDAGARFGVAPGLDADTVAEADRMGVPFLPGAATPTEVGQAVRLGLTAVKAFPAHLLGPGWIPALRGPFPELRVVATGGVDATSAPEYLRAGALGVGVGRSLAAGGGLSDLAGALSR